MSHHTYTVRVFEGRRLLADVRRQASSTAVMLRYIGWRYPTHTAAVVMCADRAPDSAEIARRAAALTWINTRFEA